LDPALKGALAALWRGAYMRLEQRTFDLGFAECAVLPLFCLVIAILWAMMRLSGGRGLFGYP